MTAEPARRAFGVSRGVAIAVAVALYAASAVWGFRSGADGSGTAPVILAPATAVSVLSLVWPRRVAVRADLRAPLRAAALLIAGYAVLGALFGPGAGPAVVAATFFVAAGAGLLAGYRRIVPGQEWFPERVGQVNALVGLVAVHGLVVVAAGGALPGQPGVVVRPEAFFVWWALLMVSSTYTVFFAFALYHPLRDRARVAYPRTLPVGAAVGVGCVLLPSIYPSYPLEWVVLIPAVWIGLTLPVRLAVTAVACLPALAHALGWFAAPAGQSEPGLSQGLAGILLVACAWVVAGIATHRERLARLIDTIAAAARQEAEQTAILDAVISSIDEGVLLAAPDGAIVLSNPAARAMVGDLARGGRWAGRWLRAHDVRALDGTALSPADLAEFGHPPPGTDLRLTLRSTEADGGERYSTVTSRALPADLGQLALVVLTDATAEHARHRELESFAGDVAHDLKGPLAAVSVWMDTADAQAEDDIDSGRRALARARRACRRMADTIDECLAYTTTRAGIVRPRDIDLGLLVREVASEYEAAGATVEVAVAEAVRADPVLVRRLIGNLIGNAVKYARPGEPARVRVSGGVHKHPGWTRILVEDRGIGISAADAERIFDRFSRTAHGSATGEGTGLGLALCRSIVERHRGTISAHRNAWGGATFEFTLPRGRTLVR